MVHAQSFQPGVKAGANFASLNGDGADALDGRTSLHFGAVLNFGFSELFAIQPEVLYSSQGYKYSSEAGDVAVALDYLNIPVLADITVAEGLSLQGGPQIGINISSKAKFDGESFDVDGIETVDLGVGIGAQYKLPMGLFFQARYVIGFTDIADGAESKNAVIGISAGWFFN